MASDKLTINMVSESDITVQGHGVHTAYDEIATALEEREDVRLVRGAFGEQIDCDIVHFHTIGTHTWRKLFQKGPKKVVTAHVVPASFVGSIKLARYWLFAARWYMRWYYNRADKVLAVSNTVAKILETELRVPTRKIETFYNTVDMAKYAPRTKDREKARQKLGIAKDAFVVLGNGQVQPRKRLDVFVEMARTLPDVQFVWVGGIPFGQLGAAYSSMKDVMSQASSNFTVTGMIPHEDVLAYLHAADVFCLPAEQENHPMCVLEAAGAKLPIVLRDLPEYDDTFADDALRCTDETFAEAISELRANKQMYAKWQQKTARIAERFDSTAATERYIKLYKSLL